MARTRKSKAPDITEAVLDRFAGPARHASRPGRHVGAAADWPARAALHRLRRQDSGSVRARHTGREIQAFLLEMYAVDVSPDLISSVTDAVHAEAAAWQQRALEPMYPVVFFDALRVRSAMKAASAARRCISRPRCRRVSSL